MQIRFTHLFPFTTLALLATFEPAAHAWTGDVLAPTRLASHSPAGLPGNNWSSDAAISRDGRFVAFGSAADNLVAGDTNGNYDIFVSDSLTGTVELISVSATGGPSDGPSGQPSISADGRYVCFESGTTNLVSPPSSGIFAIFMRDRLTGVTELASVNDFGAQANNTTELSSISPDGRYVSFASYADNLFPGHPIAGLRDIYLHDRVAQTTILVSRAFGGGFANSFSYRSVVSENGRFVAFHSQADNLVAGGTTPGRQHIFVYDVQNDVLTHHSVDAGGAEANGDSYAPALSADGRFLAFETYASNILPLPPMGSTTVILKDLMNGSILDVNLDTRGNSLTRGSHTASLSDDGRFVAFHSGVVLHNETGGLYVRDRLLNKTFAACSKSNGDGSTGGTAYGSRISGDGTSVVIQSNGELVSGISSSLGDVYVRGVGAPMTYCDGKLNSAGCKPSMGFSGEARVSNGFALNVQATDVLNNKVGLLLHGASGGRVVPLSGGLLCVASPLARSIGVLSGGNPAPAADCSGVWSLDLGAVLAASPIGNGVVEGSVLYMQYWGRDPGFPAPDNVQLSNALQVVVGP